MRLRTLFSLCSGVLGLALLIATASASASTFTAPVQLKGTDGTTTAGPFGGEPSIAADSLGHVYVQSPVGIPSGLGGTPGTGFWISNDDGSTFSNGKYIGSYLGGGDGDVIVTNTPKPNTVFNADLEAAATEVCQSTDFGKTFTGVGPFPDPSNCTTINGGQAGPSDDRPWLTYDAGGNHLYLTYHEFISAQPIAFRSDNAGGDDFLNPCGSLVTDPAIEANVPQDATGGTLVARPVVDKHGNLYVLFATTTQQENAAAAASGQPSGTFSQLYMAVSKDHCQSFTDYTVYDGSQGGAKTNTVQFGDIFNDLAIDGAGNLYVVGDGYVNTSSSTATTWFLRSSDAGQHWTQPAQLDPAGAKSSAYMLPAAIGGPKAGQLAIGYFRTTNGKTDPNDTAGTWTYSTAESTDANSAHPAFSYSDVSPGSIFHTGEICNLGILCGTIPGGPSDRSLLDFSSVALDPHGCPLFTFAGNTPQSETNGQTWNLVTRQTSGCLSSSTSTKPPPKKHHKPTKHKKHHKPAKPKKHHKPSKHKQHTTRHAENRSASGFTG